MGSLTLLFRQPVAALQVLTKSGEWKYVRPQMDALTVNIADALQFMTSKSPRISLVFLTLTGSRWLSQIKHPPRRRSTQGPSTHRPTGRTIHGPHRG
jgi:hypothetical protein